MFWQLFFKNKSKNKSISNAYLDKRTPMWKPFLMMTPGLLVILFFTVIPFMTTVDTAFHPEWDDVSEKRLDGTFSWTLFKYLLDDPSFSSGIKNTLIYAAVSLPISIAISLLISSLIVSIINKYTRSAFQTIFFIPYVTSVVAVGLAFVAILQRSNILNSILGTDIQWLNGGVDSKWSIVSIIIHGVWSSLAFQILIFSTAMLGVDKGRYKSASIDGAGPITQFFKITLPSINRTMGFIITIGLISSIKINPSVLWDNEPGVAMQNNGTTILLYIYRSLLGATPKYGQAAAASLVLLIISIAFSFVVKNSLKLISLSVEKGAAFNVNRKIKGTTMTFKD